ncbi:hypothetical protein C0J52_04018 [Blattella germanica]|nr:hypothetical protein C0J52_04018 [Blattella germanica]
MFVLEKVSTPFSKEVPRIRRVLTEGRLNYIGARLQVNPRKSLTRLAAQCGISKSTVHVTTNLLKLKLYKIRNVHNLLPLDSVARIEFCRWFLQSVNDGSLDPGLTFFSDEAWFTLNGRVNS